MEFITVKAPGSKRVHLSIEMNDFGQSVAMCGRISSHVILSTDDEATCKKCLELAAEMEPAEEPEPAPKPHSGPKKQGTRMVKLVAYDCHCQYTVRTTRKWLAEGFPCCPHGAQMKEID